MDDLDLDELKRVADAAETWTGGGCVQPWYKFDEYSVRRVNRLVVAETRDQDEATHIATFDPPTVKRLIARVRKAEEHDQKHCGWKALETERDQLKARVAELEERILTDFKLWEAKTAQVGRLQAKVLTERRVKNALIEAWEEAAEAWKDAGFFNDHSHEKRNACNEASALESKARALEAGETEGGE